MILITGSTGNLGASVIGFLAGKGIPPDRIVAFARDGSRAEKLDKYGVHVRIGNYDDYDSLLKAFKAIDKLLFISGSEIDKRDMQHDNIIKAAVNAGVNHIIYTSFERKNDDLSSPLAFIAGTHIETEQKILRSGLPYTFLRNSLYAEGLPMFLGEDAMEKGVLVPAGNGRVPFASRTDMAEAAANILAGSDEHTGKSYKTVNSMNYSFYDVAAAMDKLSDRQIGYVNITPDEYSALMLKAGANEQAINAMLLWFEGIRSGYFEADRSDMEMLLGRPPADLLSVLESVYALKHTRRLR